MMGVTGEAGRTSLRKGMHESGTSPYSLIALSLMLFVDQFQGVGFFILAPEISQGLGLSRTTLGSLLALKLLILALVSFPIAAAVQRVIRAGLRSASRPQSSGRRQRSAPGWRPLRGACSGFSLSMARRQARCRRCTSPCWSTPTRRRSGFEC